MTGMRINMQAVVDVYHFPGLQKVVQTARRAIRTQTDRGVIYLIDDRFARANVMRLLPGWWKVGR